MGRKLVILHVDGVSADSLEQALREGEMPFVKHLIDAEGYVIHRYRCGVPSTTPFAQAGILYATTRRFRAFDGGTGNAESWCSSAPARALMRSPTSTSGTATR